MRNVLIGLASVMVAFTLPFMLCTFLVASTKNMGFNVVLTGLLLLFWETGSIWLMKKGPQAMSHGFLIGVSVVMFFVTIMTAIYWGQLSYCDAAYDGDLDQYTCDNKSSMRGVAAFASLVWIFQIPFTILIIQHRNTITKEASYDDIGATAGAGDYAYDQGTSSYGYSGSPKGQARDL
ncbi:unnamed protein product [Phaeothamnion confervicola]